MTRIGLMRKADLLHRLPPASERQAIRRAAKLTQRDLAEQRGITTQAVAAWERGATPSPDHLAWYVDLLDSLRVYSEGGTP